MQNVIMQNYISITTGSGGPGVGDSIGVGGSAGNASVNINGLASFPRADYARHDFGRKDAPLSCLEGTRVAILDEIMSWLESANEERPPIYWLNGLAGIGKSTIARTIADRAEQRGMLGASFFFSRDNGPLCDPQLVFPTIAFQLARSDDAFRDVIMDAVRQDTTLVHQTLLPQLRGLILTPLLNVNPSRRATLIVLDALDECEESGAAEILQLLFLHATRIPFLRILVTSRPEPHISYVFDGALNHTKRILHDIDTAVIQQDIRLYLETELAKIPQKLRLRMDPNWASEGDINSLVERSGKLFVYAATSIRFISDNRMRNPRRHLHLILNTQTAREVEATPYTQLDNLYMGVLRNSLSDSNRRDVLERFQVVVGSIVLLREPLSLHSLAHFISYEVNEIDAALYHLRSVIPSDDDEVLRIYHPSFRDFIMDPSRCSDMGFVIVPVPQQERRHAIRCFELLAKFLKRDVAGISDPSLLNCEVDGFEQKVRNALSPEVQYACGYWASHLSRVEFGDKMMVQVLEEFSMRSILWWFEAMSLMGSVSTAISSIQEAHRWATASKCELILVTMLADAHRFILAHAEVIRSSALHVYQSALPFTPHDTALYKAYCREANHSIRVLQGVESQWPRNLSSLLGHSGPVSSVAYSLNGLRLASGSSDRTVRLWDAMSSALIATLEGHSRPVSFVIFSPDGLRLASASYDSTVRLWDAMSSALIAALEGHSCPISPVIFSPDSLRLASGSEDGTVWLWDAMSGAPIARLEGHSDPVFSVTFSPGGLRLASGSYDCTVRLWDAMSGAPIATLEGHSSTVSCVKFSPDGLRLASASYDSTVRLWDATSGAPIATLEGHSRAIVSISFSSPDGLRVASGSDDCAVRLWDAMSGAPIAMLEGHSAPVSSVTFSPDGLRLASGSGDSSVRLWDAMSGAPIATLEGHSGKVRSVTFAPDGLRLASGSDDSSVRLWDAMSPGMPITTLEGHSGSVFSVTFPPDGLQLASYSHDDRSVRLWDAMSGTPIAMLDDHSGPVSSFTFSSDSLRLASGSEDGTVRLWDAMSSTPIAMLKGHYSLVWSVTFSPDSLRLASGSSDRTVRLWDVMSGALIATLKGHSDVVSCVTFSPDGLQLASGSDDRTVRLWDAMSGMLIAILKGHSSPISIVAFSPDSSRLASGSWDNSVRLWDAMSGALIATLKGHSALISSITFSSDAQIIISESDWASEVFTWDLTSQPPCRLDSKSSVASYPSGASLPPLIWSRNGQWIQVQRRFEDHVRRICYIPPFYSPSTRIEGPSLPNLSPIAIGCRNGRVIILDIQHHPLCT